MNNYLSDSAPRLKNGSSRLRIHWAPAASWNLEHKTEEALFHEISRILAASMAGAQVSVTPKHHDKAISHSRLRQVSACINLCLFMAVVLNPYFYVAGLQVARWYTRK